MNEFKMNRVKWVLVVRVILAFMIFTRGSILLIAEEVKNSPTVLIIGPEGGMLDWGERQMNEGIKAAAKELGWKLEIMVLNSKSLQSSQKLFEEFLQKDQNFLFKGMVFIVSKEYWPHLKNLLTRSKGLRSPQKSEIPFIFLPHDPLMGIDKVIKSEILDLNLKKATIIDLDNFDIGKDMASLAVKSGKLGKKVLVISLEAPSQVVNDRVSGIEEVLNSEGIKMARIDLSSSLEEGHEAKKVLALIKNDPRIGGIFCLEMKCVEFLEDAVTKIGWRKRTYWITWGLSTTIAKLISQGYLTFGGGPRSFAMGYMGVNLINQWPYLPLPIKEISVGQEWINKDRLKLFLDIGSLGEKKGF